MNHRLNALFGSRNIDIVPDPGEEPVYQPPMNLSQPVELDAGDVMAPATDHYQACPICLGACDLVAYDDFRQPWYRCGDCGEVFLSTLPNAKEQVA